MKIVGLLVRGDGDETYTITAQDGAATCTCPAFRFAPEGREGCKHISFAVDRLAAMSS